LDPLAGYPHPFGTRSGGWPSRRPAFLLAIALVLLGGFYAVSRPRVERAPPQRQPPLVGQAWIVDGDSIRMAGRSIRLDGIDAPEWDQTCLDAGGRSWRCGGAATRALRERTRGQTVSCRPRALDHYGRTLAVCALADGSDLNAWLVRQGFAIASGFAGTYAAEQAEAKAARRGIWDGTFISPADWRRQKAGRPHHRPW
jgi:endonuclease YncB( thermonuclease family)